MVKSQTDDGFHTFLAQCASSIERAFTKAPVVQELTVWDSIVAPTVPLVDYLEMLWVKTDCSLSVLAGVALICNTHAPKQATTSIHRFVAAVFVVSHKFIEDALLTLPYYADVTGLRLRELAGLEAHLLCGVLRWRLTELQLPPMSVNHHT